jgi:CDP-glucose 4,6-dehydratase
MEDLVTFWKNKKVLITGHTGFKGGWLTLWLNQLQANVVGYSLAPPTETNLFTVAEVGKNMHDIRGDVRDFAALNEVILTHQPEIIFHMAAQPLVRYSYTNPIETYATNVMGTVNLLEAVRTHGHTRAVVNVTTDKCYENKEWHWGYRENEPMGGYDPYSNSKGCAELVTSAFRNSYFNPAMIEQHQMGLASGRAGNVIGGGDWAADRLIPDLMTACAEQQTVKIRYPHSIRPWQHVLEPLSGYIQLAQALYQQPDVYAEAWNFGPDNADAKPVAWIADQVLKLWGGKNHWELVDGVHAHEATYLKLDCAKAHSKLKWQPKWNIHQALKETVAWHQAYQAGKNMRDVTLMQIIKYMNFN